MATSSTLEAVSTVHHWIGGESVETGSGRTGVVWNPATGDQHAVVNFATVAEVDAAVAAAKAAFPAWRATSLSRRAEILFKLRSLLDENRDTIAAITSTENGKTLSDAAGEVARG